MSDTFAPGSWLSVRAWADADGYHIWLAHDCVNERTTTMLPWPVWHAGPITVEPSVSCEACGLHTFVEVRPLEPHEPDAIAWASS